MSGPNQHFLMQSIPAPLVTQVLYKYLEHGFARRMLSQGEIRLGTLYGFRDEEQLGPEVGDRDEGAITLKTSGLTVVDTGGAGGVPFFLRDKIKAAGGARIQIVARDGVGRRHEDSDCWVYCTNDRYDKDLMRSLGYDACVEILDIEQFFFAISRKVQHHVSLFWGAAKCVYRDRGIEHTDYDQTPPAFIKPPRLAHQAEVRAVWLPKTNAPIAPITVRAKKVVRLCRLFRAGIAPSAPLNSLKLRRGSHRSSNTKQPEQRASRPQSDAAAWHGLPRAIRARALQRPGADRPQGEPDPERLPPRVSSVAFEHVRHSNLPVLFFVKPSLCSCDHDSHRREPFHTANA